MNLPGSMRGFNNITPFHESPKPFLGGDVRTIIAVTEVSYDFNSIIIYNAVATIGIAKAEHIEKKEDGISEGFSMFLIANPMLDGGKCQLPPRGAVPHIASSLIKKNNEVADIRNLPSSVAVLDNITPLYKSPKPSLGKAFGKTKATTEGFNNLFAGIVNHPFSVV